MLGLSRGVNSTEAKSTRSARSKCSLRQEDEKKEDASMDIAGIIGMGRVSVVRFDSTHQK
jgi:hypothetical protein